MEQWFSSDHHFEHARIIEFAGRPFADINEMKEVLIEQHNLYVKPSDHVTFLGDVTMERSKAEEANFIETIQRMNGHKRLLLGNHDHFPIEVYLRAGFKEVLATKRINNIIFSHIPLHPLSIDRVEANVHGHTHEWPNFPAHKREDGKIIPWINISLERTNYHPLNLGEIQQLIKTEREKYG